MTVLALVLAAATGSGMWIYFNQQNQGQGSDLVGPPEPTLMSTALHTATDLGSFLQENVSRDLSRFASVLARAADEGAEETQPQETVPTPKDTGNDTAELAPRRALRVPSPSPTLRFGIDSLQGAVLPKEPPLFMVFDHGHSDVIPPGTGTIRLRTRQFQGKPLARVIAELQHTAQSGAAAEKLGLVEVLISESGDVEHVRLLGPPQVVHESMLLSAIKAWHFEPALKDGQSVRYRQVMPIAVAHF